MLGVSGYRMDSQRRGVRGSGCGIGIWELERCLGCSGEGMQEGCSEGGMQERCLGLGAHREGCSGLGMLRGRDAQGLGCSGLQDTARILGGMFGGRDAQREGCLGTGMREGTGINGVWGSGYRKSVQGSGCRRELGVLGGVWVQEGCSGTGIPKGRPAQREGFLGEWVQQAWLG